MIKSYQIIVIYSVDRYGIMKKLDKTNNTLKNDITVMG